MEDHKTEERQQAAASPRVGRMDFRHMPWVTLFVLGLSVVLFGVEVARFGAEPSVVDLARMGAVYHGVVQDGHWWALIVANFLHVNLIHLASNCLVIYLVGTVAERLYGTWRFALIVLAGAILSSIGVLLIAPAGEVSVGASGIAFAMIGAGIAADPKADIGIGAVCYQLLVLNLFLTFTVSGISVGGHLGGMVAGLALGFPLASSIRRRRSEVLAQLDERAGIDRGAAQQPIPALHLDALPGSEREVIAPNRVRALGLGVVMLAFAAVGIGMVNSGEPLGWLAVLIFLPFGALSLFTAIVGMPRLTLARTGFELRTLRGRVQLPWEAVDTMELVVKQRGNRASNVIAYRLKPGYRLPHTRLPDHAGGYDGDLGGGWSVEPEQLMARIQHWSGGEMRTRPADTDGEVDDA